MTTTHDQPAPAETVDVRGELAAIRAEIDAAARRYTATIEALHQYLSQAEFLFSKVQEAHDGMRAAWERLRRLETALAKQTQ